jgi:hypothetical protein
MTHDREDERGESNGQSVILASECEKRVAEAIKEAISECIAAVEWLHDHEAPHDAHRDALWNALIALRGLQEKP